MSRQCSSCGSSGPFARGGGPHCRLCPNCASNQPQGRGPVVHAPGRDPEKQRRLRG